MVQKFRQFLTWLTGAEKDEQPLVLLCFAAIFLLLVSYYIVKPMRNSQFLKEFPPNYKPFFFLVSAMFSLLFTKIFNHFFVRVNMHRLVGYTFLAMICFKLLFTGIFLLESHQWAVIAFYFWASSYFLLCISVTWGAINYLFSPEQSRRCFGFIAVGATLGAWIGAPLTRLLIENNLRDYLLVVSAVIMFFTMFFMAKASNFAKNHKVNNDLKYVDDSLVNESKSDSSLLKDIIKLFKHHYARCLAIMVFALAVSNTILDFQSDPIIDTEVASKSYLSSFEELNTLLNSSNSKEINSEGFQFVYGYKFQANEDRSEYIRNFLQTNPRVNSLSVQYIQSKFVEFKDSNYDQMGIFYSTTYSLQNVLGLLLLLLSRMIFKLLSVRFAIMLLPLFFLVAGNVLNLDIGLEIIQILMVVGGALNYSINNVTKEVLYTPTSKETKGKLKAIIDGPMMRIGDLFASVVKISLVLLLGEAFYANAFLAVGLIVVVIWVLSVWYAAGIYQKNQAAGSTVTI
tara:strand:+ start:14326 stop:15864 length:1539 start_codon:yes stop_codon:yes gene_type:complete